MNLDAALVAAIGAAATALGAVLGRRGWLAVRAKELARVDAASIGATERGFVTALDRVQRLEARADKQSMEIEATRDDLRVTQSRAERCEADHARTSERLAVVEAGEAACLQRVEELRAALPEFVRREVRATLNPSSITTMEIIDTDEAQRHPSPMPLPPPVPRETRGDHDD